jgi:uncharacterized membrane protein
MPSQKRPRLPFLDWMRGVAAVIMLQGHTFHSFTRNDLRNQGPYVLSQFFGGIGPAIFLFLTGITFAFIMERGERDALNFRGRLIAALKRSRYLFLLAFLFRLQMWAFGYPYSPWTDLLKVDVLNCMGFTMLVLSPLALVTKERRARLAALIGLAIAGLSPVVSATNWSWLPATLSNYIVPSYLYFSFFPWAAFLAFGISAGCILKMITADQLNRLMQWSTLLGFALIIGGQYFSNVPYSIYSKSEFWLNSPGLVIIKLGVLMMLIAFCYLWTEYVLREKWSWVKQLGTTSLLVYWVHIELVYGRWFGGWKESLDSYQCAAFAAVLIVAMVGLSVVRTRLKGVPITNWIPALQTLTPRRVSGD